MRRDLQPELNKFAEYEICYGNRFYVGNEAGYNIKSSGFTVGGISETVYLGDLPAPHLNTGSIFFVFILHNKKVAVAIDRETPHQQCITIGLV